jgi:DNA repair exonuclease SbcCD ATPase subunit
MSIHFKKIRWQNFLSTGNQWTEIELDRNKSTLIIGENGSGKSTMLDAVCFSLYGNPYRNINKPLLVNSINSKNCLVEVEFNIKGKKYLVRRGIKPNIFEIYCNGKMIEQNASIKEYQDVLEKNILKLNYKSFTQIIVIGSANYTPFMQLKAQERRSIIEDLLDIEIFSKMFQNLKTIISTNKDNIVETKYNIDLLNKQIEITKKHITELVSIQNSDIENKKNKIQELKSDINQKTEEIEKLLTKIKEMSNHILDVDAVNQKLNKLKNYEYQFNHKIDHINNEINFLNNNDTCPTCAQQIDNVFKENSITCKEHKKKEISDTLSQLHEHLSEHSKRLEEINETQKDIAKLNQQILFLNSDINSCNSRINELNQQINENNNELQSDSHLDNIKSLNSDLTKQQKRYETLLKQKEVYDVSYTLLKDSGIKSKIIKQYIPIINKLMNKYLTDLDFFIQFELDENFNEKIRSRHRDDFIYESFSEGEKMRINLALLFTWRAVSKLRNSISTNLLIMDEVFDSSLDNSGTDEFLKMVMDLTKDTNVFIISHKGQSLFDKFNNIIRFEKIKNFSQIANGVT